MKFSKSSGETPRTYAIRHMRRAIATNEWQHGERLPTELALAARLGLSRKTIRAAYEQLENDGLIICKGTSGRFRMSATANIAAHTLSRTIGVYLPESIRDEYRADKSVWGDVIAGIIAATRRADYNVTFFNNRILASPESLFAAKPDGLIVPTFGFHAHDEFVPLMQALKKRGIPVALGVAESIFDTFDILVPDHKNAMEQAVEALAQRGVRHILRVWLSEKTSWIKERDAGYDAAVKRLGLPGLPPLHTPELLKRSDTPDPQNFYIRTRQYLGFLTESLKSDTPPDAVIVSSDCDVFAISAACKLFGIHPGKDLVIVGFDNYWRHCWERVLEDVAPIFTVDKQSFAWGEAFVQLLLDRIANRLPQHGIRRKTPAHLVFTE